MVVLVVVSVVLVVNWWWWLVVRRAAFWRLGLPLENIEAGITVLFWIEIGCFSFFFLLDSGKLEIIQMFGTRGIDIE